MVVPRGVLQQVPDQSGGNGVDPLEGLIQEEDRRPMDDRRPEGYLLLHASRVVAYQLRSGANQVEHVEQLAAALQGLVFVESVHCRGEVE